MTSLLPIGSLWAGQEDYSDGKDYSKEVSVVEKSWYETPSLWEVVFMILAFLLFCLPLMRLLMLPGT